MPVNKGLLSIVENEPNFSNQALENAVNDIKAVDKDDGHQFILSQFLLDTAIRNNPVLTTSQKNDVLETIYAAQPHLQIGRTLTDVVRHTASIIDATIVPVPADETQTETFLGILQNVQAMQSLIPELFGVPAKDKGRAVNDHVGTLNNIFLTTVDSSEPVFTRLKRIMELIDANSRVTSALNLAISNASVANLNLRTFLTTITDDSTDFQETLDNRVNSVVAMFNTLQTRIAQIPGNPTTDLVAIKDEITDQVSLENRNISNLSSTIDTLSDNLSFASLAEDSDLGNLMSTVAQNKQWQTYFEDYENEKGNINPIYTTNTDSDKSAIIDQVLADSGLPDVTDASDFEAVANKASRDSRIDTANYDRFTVEQKIIKSCEQLGITTANRTISALSGTLLRNMNQHDRDEIARQLDSNESADTLS
tara:strand:- start:1556 stop:2824 length:1269 start_codon:yes stop_codon:yes gene_type:complete